MPDCGKAVTSLDILTIVIAIFGALTGVLAIAWQVISFLLTGGRVRVKLISAWTGPGGAMSTWAPGEQPSRSFDRERLGVEVRNIGRLPVSISDWNLDIGGVRLGYFTDEWAPPIPHRLESGESATWLVDVNLVTKTAKALTKRGPAEIRARASIAGSDKEKKSKNKLTYPDDAGRLLPT